MSQNHQIFDSAVNRGNQMIQLGEVQFKMNDNQIIQNQIYINNSFDALIRRNNAENIQSIEEKQEQGSDKYEKEDLKIKKNLVIGIIIIFVFISSTISALIATRPQAREEPNMITTTIIMKRNFERGKVFYNSYIVNIQNSNQNNSIQINYTLVVAISQIDRQSIQFVAVIQKRSEQKFLANGSTLKYFDQTNKYLNILKYGVDNLTQPIDPTINRTIDHISSPLNSNQSYKEFDPIIPMFKFRTQTNGNILYFVFPDQMQKQLVGLLRSIVKLFSPRLDTTLYTENAQLSKKEAKLGSYVVRSVQDSRVMASDNSSNFIDNNTITNQDLTYQENKNYGFQTQDEGISLRNDESVTSASKAHNTDETNSQQNQFDSNGQLLTGKQRASTNFNSVYNPPSQNYSTLNLNLNFSSDQNSQMSSLQIFIANPTFVQQFQSLLDYYTSKNKTLNLTTQQLSNYVINYDNSNNAQANTTRLLLESDGSMSLINFNKQAKILYTNLIGFEIGALGYAKLKFNLYQDPKNRYKKTPKIVAQSGVVLALGFYKFTIPLADYQKQFPPFTFKYTLTQIQSIVDLIRGDFISEVQSLWNIILNQNFQLSFLPKILSLASKVEDLNNLVKNVQTQMSPLDVINKILIIINNIHWTIQNQGNAILGPEIEWINNIKEQLLQFTNQSYVEALNAFMQTKSNFSSLNIQGYNFLIQKLKSFTQQDIVLIKQQIQTIIPDDIYIQYERQMQKAKIIIDLIIFVTQNGNNYLSYVGQTIIDHKKNLLKLVKGVSDLYFQNQTLKIDYASSFISQRIQTIVQDYNNYTDLMNNVNISNMNIKTIQLFQTVLFSKFQNDSDLQTWNQFITDLQSLANGVAAQRDGPCCAWYKPAWYQFWEHPYCYYYNNAFGAQAAEPDIFSSLSEGLTSIYTQLLNSTIQFTIDTDDIIQNDSISITEKYEQIKNNYYVLASSVTTDNIDNFIDMISQRLQAANDMLPKAACGGTTNLRAYIAKLQDFQSFTTDFKNQYILLGNTSQSMISTFNPKVYTAILNHTVIVASVNTFLQSYQGMEGDIKSVISNLTKIVHTYDPEDMAKSVELITSVYYLYTNISQRMQRLCDNKDSQQTAIMNIRKQYQVKLNLIKNLSNQFLSQELVKLVQFLNQSSTNFYDKYFSLKFCEQKIEFQNKISELFPDMKNFTIIFQLYNDFMTLKFNTQNQLVNLTQILNSLQSNLYRLFTPQGFFKFVHSVDQLSIDLKQLIDNTSMSYCHLKEDAKSIYMFNMATSQKLSDALSLFTNSSFLLSSSSMFGNIEDFINKSLGVINSLSFDVITVVVSARDVISYFNQVILKFTNGTQQITTQFNGLCTNFLNLGNLVEQDYLNNLNTSFSNLINKLNDTIFPNVTIKMNQIINRYRNYTFNNKNLQNQKVKSFIILTNFANMAENCKSNIFSKIKQIFTNLLKLIDNLEIGGLNSVYQLGVTLKTEFDYFISSFQGSLQKVIDLKGLITSDLRNVFNLSTLLQTIKNDMKSQYVLSINKIYQSINKTKEQVKHLQKFNQKFLNATIYQQLSQTSIFEMGFVEAVFDKIQNFVQQAQNSLQSITNNSLQIIQKIGAAKQKLQNVKARIQQRVQNITDQLRTIKMKFVNIRSLAFILLRSDLKGTVMSSLNKISDQVDKIVQVQLKSIQEVANGGLGNRVQQIGNTIQILVTGYGAIKQQKQVALSYIEIGLDKIDQFLLKNVTMKMQKLKQALLFINSQTNLQDPISSLLLYQKNIFSFSAPIYVYHQVILTAIGTFSISFDLSFVLDIYAKIMLKQYRSLQFSVVFTAALYMEITFGYGLAYILQFGLFVKGYVLRAELTIGTQMTNLIPIQLVPAIAQMTELQKINKASFNFFVDLAIYAVELTVGFYIKHISIDILWVDISFCINLLFFSFCISFRLPIGIIFVFLRHDFGFAVVGVQVLKKRILTLKILDWQY